MTFTPSTRYCPVRHSPSFAIPQLSPNNNNNNNNKNNNNNNNNNNKNKNNAFIGHRSRDFHIMLAKSMQSMHQIARIEFRNAQFSYARGRCPFQPLPGGSAPGPPPGHRASIPPPPFPAARSAPAQHN